MVGLSHLRTGGDKNKEGRMDDIKMLFQVNTGREIKINTVDEREFLGKVEEAEDAQDNHLLFRCDDGTYCIFYRHIIFVKLD